MNPNKAQNLNKSYKENIPQFWEDLYQTNYDKWDLREATPIFKQLATELPLGRVCIIGCGRGYDAIEFAKKGFQVTAIDFAPSAISSLKNMANLMEVSLEIIRKNIFDLLPEYHLSLIHI